MRLFTSFRPQGISSIHSLISKICLVIFVTAFYAQGAPKNPAGFEIGRGINLSHWLSQDYGWFDRDQFITENDLKYIASLGYDHVRFPIDEEEIWNEDGTFNESALGYLHKGIQWALKNDLRVIVDMHVVRSHHFNALNEGGMNTLFEEVKEQEHFITLWRDLIGEIGKYPVDKVAYEIMNEAVADDHEDWNKLIAKTMKAIRALEKNRVVVIGSNKWQGPYTFPFLKVPEGDQNIILSMHTYAPFGFTHYRANWTPFKVYEGEVNYPGPTTDAATVEWLKAMNDSRMDFITDSLLENWGVERLYQELKPAIERSKALGLQLYCGEFGCMPTVDSDQRMAYYRDIVAVFKDNGVAWANWEYKGDFGIFEWFYEPDFALGAPNVEMIDALLGNRPCDK